MSLEYKTINSDNTVDEEIYSILYLKVAHLSCREFVTKLERTFEKILLFTEDRNFSSSNQIKYKVNNQSFACKIAPHCDDFRLVNLIRRLDNAHYFACNFPALKRQSLIHKIWHDSCKINEVNDIIYKWFNEKLKAHSDNIIDRKEKIKTQHDKIHRDIESIRLDLFWLTKKISSIEKDSKPSDVYNMENRKIKLKEEILTLNNDKVMITRQKNIIIKQEKDMKSLIDHILATKEKYLKCAQEIMENHTLSDKEYEWYSKNFNITSNSIKGKLLTLGKTDLRQWYINQKMPIDILKCAQENKKQIFTLNMNFIKPKFYIHSLKDDKEFSLQELIYPDKTSFILIGPPGSGKTTLFCYILHQFLSENDAISTLGFYDLVVFLRNENEGHKSFTTQMKEQIFKTCFNDNQKESIWSVLERINVLFLVEFNNYISERDKQALCEMFKYKYKNKIILGIRTQNLNLLLGILEAINEPYKAFYMKHLSGKSLESFVNIMTLEQGQSKKQADDFLKVINKLELDNTLLTPLYLIYLNILWKQEPSRLNSSLTSYQLLNEIFNLGQNNFLQQECKQKSVVEKILKHFFQEVIVQLMNSHSIRLSCRNVEVKCNNINIGYLITKYFYPFILLDVNDSIVHSLTYNCRITHPIIMEFLAGRYLGVILASVKFLPFPLQWTYLLKCTSHNIKNRLKENKNIIHFSLQHLSNSKSLNYSTGKKLVSLLLDNEVKTNFEFLKIILVENDFHRHIKKIMRQNLSTVRKIDFCNEREQIVESVCLLLQHSVIHLDNLYFDGNQKNMSYILPELPKKENKSMEVRFYGKNTPADNVILSLIPNRNLTELVGSITEKGALNLRYMERLRSVTVYINSETTYINLAKSIQTENLISIKLRINEFHQMNPDNLPPLKIGHAELEIIFSDIKQGDISCIINLVKRITDNCSATKLRLNNTWLSRRIIDNLRTSLRPIQVESTGLYYKDLFKHLNYQENTI